MNILEGLFDVDFTEDFAGEDLANDEDLTNDEDFANDEDSKQSYYLNEPDPAVFASASRYRTPNDIVANAIVQSRADGIDRYEIGRYIGLNGRTKTGNRRITTIIDQFSKKFPSQIGKYEKMEGRIRTQRFFYKGAESTPTTFLEATEKLEQLLGQKCPYSCADTVSFPGKNLPNLRISDITLRRFLFILELLRDDGIIVTLTRIIKHISQLESELDYKFTIDKKSVLKCLYALEQKELLRVHFVTYVAEDEDEPKGANNATEANDDGESSNESAEENPNAHVIQIVTPWDIEDADDPRITDAINRAKEQFNEEGRVFPTGIMMKTTAQETKAKSTPSSKKTPRKPKKKPARYEEKQYSRKERFSWLRYNFDSNKKDAAEETEDAEDADVKPNFDPDADYGCQAKLTRCAILHEYIFHVIHGMEHDERVPNLYHRFPPNKQLPIENEPTPLDELPTFGDDDVHNPFRHVTRIPPFKGLQRGWFMVRDVLLGMPLSILALIVKFKRRIEGMEEYLSDPEKRHLPLGDLPIRLRKQIFNRSSALVVEYLCLILSTMGLMRIAPAYENKINMFGPNALFFCGKQTFLYDTSTSERGYALVTQPITKYPRYDYVFETVRDVHKYWNHLKAICWSTSLGARHVPERQESNFKSDSRKYSQGLVDRTMVMVDIKVPIDALSPIGTADGCAGLDAQLFCHLPRNWELRAPQNPAIIDWFIQRWQQIATLLSSYVEQRVARLERNWNSYISSFLPTDMDMIRKKKADIPILTQRTMDAMGGNLRRHHTVRRALVAKPATKLAKKPKTTAAAIASLIETVSKDTLFPEEDEEEEEAQSKKKAPNTRSRKRAAQDADEQPGTSTSKARGAVKRKPDKKDLESAKLTVHTRSRFIAREYDMLVLIRSVSYFLNPIHRFWLNPAVMRDIMHEYVPESRSKTISSLLAASAREMLRPGRTAQLQYIVKTLSSHQSMLEIREKLARQEYNNEDERDNIFLQAFKTAHKLIFNEQDQMPSANVGDADFQAFLERKKMEIAVADTSANAIFPRRSRKPETIEDIQHCVAFNAVMSTLVSDACRSADEPEPNENGSLRVDFLINSISSSALTETLEICRSDGLITRVRNKDKTTYLVRNQMTISIYYRHYFNHFYRGNLIDLLKDVLQEDPQQLSTTSEDNPAIFLRQLDYFSAKEQPVQVDLSEAAHVIERRQIVPLQEGEEKDDKKPVVKSLPAVKNVKQLEASPLQLEKIHIHFPPWGKELRVPSKEDVLPIVGPVYGCKSTNNAGLKAEFVKQIKANPALCNELTVDAAFNLLNVINAAKHDGVPVAELKEKSGLDPKAVDLLLDLFARFEAAFPCGVDVKRYVGVEFSLPWLIKTDTHRFSVRPWTRPDGSVNWPVLRWMSESVLLTVHFKPGISATDLCNLYSYVLMPVLLDELVEFLVALGCFDVSGEELASIKLASPFPPSTKSREKYLKLTADALNRFALFFADTPLLENAILRKGETAKQS